MYYDKDIFVVDVKGIVSGYISNDYYTEEIKKKVRKIISDGLQYAGLENDITFTINFVNDEYLDCMRYLINVYNTFKTEEINVDKIITKMKNFAYFLNNNLSIENDLSKNFCFQVSNAYKICIITDEEAKDLSYVTVS